MSNSNGRSHELESLMTALEEPAGGDGVSFDDLVDDMESAGPARPRIETAYEPEPEPHDPEAFEPEPLAYEPEPFQPEAVAYEPEPAAYEPEPLAYAPMPEPEPEPHALAPEPSVAGPDGVHTFRGESLEELIPRIRGELGPDAIVLKQRTGLSGGIGGFFQKRCVEVDARAGAPRLDLYDEGPAEAYDVAQPAPAPFVPPPAANPYPLGPTMQPPAAPEPPLTPTQEGFASPAIEELVRQAQPFAEQLGAAARAVDAEPLPVAPAAPAVPAAQPVVAARGERPPRAEVLQQKLTDCGIAPALAADVVGEAVTHRLPFTTPGRIASVVRETLARRIPVAPPAQPAGRTIAIVGAPGAGKTAAVAALAAAYAAGSDLPVLCLSLRPADRGESLAAALRGSGVQPVTVPDGAEAAKLIAEVRDRALVVLDTPSISPADPKAVTALRRDLRALGGAEVQLALRAATSRPAAGEQATSLAPLGLAGIVLTHAAETTYLGPVVDLAIAGTTPLAFVAEGPGAIAPADAGELARRLLP